MKPLSVRIRQGPFVKILPNGRQALAVRAEPEVDPAALVTALGLPVPAGLLILSGGAGQMSAALAAPLSDLFAAIGPWLVEAQVTVIDGGTRAGTMALLGEALARAGRSEPYIGVLPARAEVSPGGPRAEEILEPHHSHFVLIDSDEWEAEVRPMYRLAADLALGVPQVVLLINGGQITLREMEWNVRQQREIIVVAGSGRLADEIATAVLDPPDRVRERVAGVVSAGRLTLFDLAEGPDKLLALLQARLSVKL